MDPALKQEFQIALSNRFAALVPSADVNAGERQISDTMLDCAKLVCLPIHHRTPSWIPDECLDMIHGRERMKLTDYEHYRKLNREIRQRTRADREMHWNKTAATKHEYHTLYRTLRRLSGKIKSINDNSRKVDGTFIRPPTERLQRWMNFFKELNNYDLPHGSLVSDDPY